MSIFIQFNSAFDQSAITVSSNQCRSKQDIKLEMIPGIEHSEEPGMTDDEISIDISSSLSSTLKESKVTYNHSGSYFGLPYQDHNYGAPPPPTPPSHSPCPSPIPSMPVPDEDTTLSVVSNSTNEDVQEESVTRCICGYEHDDEYMISCDNCLVWQHVDCMGLDRNNMPDTYLCDQCEPRKLDRHKAKLLQSRKKGSLTALKPSTTVSSKQSLNFNNCLSGKEVKKKNYGQNIDKWSTHKTAFKDSSLCLQFNYSSDSDGGLNRNSDRRPKTRSKRRKKEDEKCVEMCELTVKRRNKKHGRERMEAKRSKMRRGKNKESTSTADEEAQDAWEYSLEWCEKNFEDAINNQYTPEIQRLAKTLNTQGFEKRYLEQMRTKQCHAYDDGKRKQLVCLRDLPRNSPLIEYKGKFLLASQFRDIHPLYNKRLYPYVLFYVMEQDEICIDASIYGNDARFVRRSCKPNAEIRHMVYNGKLHLYLSSTRVIFREDEVTIPLIIHPNDNLKDVECVCGNEECLVKPKKKNGTIEVCTERRRRTRRSTVTADEDSNNSIEVKPDIKPEVKPTRQSTRNIHLLEKLPKPVSIKTEPVEPPVVPVEDIIPVNTIKEEPEVKSASDHEMEESTNGGRRKTREERKMDAIMQRIRKMEEAEKRKNLSIEKQKTLPLKSEVPAEKNEPEPKQEEKPETTSSILLNQEKERPVPQTPKSKKGKKRRGSGTPSRRRTRTNSGGSDLMSLDESSPIKPTPSNDSNTNIIAENNNPVSVNSPPPVSASGLVSPVPAVAPSSPHILKTKRSLMNEWLQEKSETVTTPVSSPLPIHTEMEWSITSSVATCYVRCTKDSPHSSGISAAHLRRSNSAGQMKQPATGQGSAKKRWLRQAMYGVDTQLRCDPCSDSALIMDNGCLSPNCHGDVDSINGIGEDVPTPLKKRRLMRESIESLPSPQSPSTATSIEDTDATTISNSLISDNSNEHVIDTLDNEISLTEKEQTSFSSTENADHLVICMKISTENNSIEDSLKENKEVDLKSETFFTPISKLDIISNELPEVLAKNVDAPALEKNTENEVTDESSKNSELSENSLEKNDVSLPETLSESNHSQSVLIELKENVSKEATDEQDFITVNKDSDINDSVIQKENNEVSAFSSVNKNTYVKEDEVLSDVKSPLTASLEASDQSVICDKLKPEIQVSNNESISDESVEKSDTNSYFKFETMSSNMLSKAVESANISIEVNECNKETNSFINTLHSSYNSSDKLDKDICAGVSLLLEDSLKTTETMLKLDKQEQNQNSETALKIEEVNTPVKKEISTSQQAAKEDIKVKTCSSATQKRKVSLSEYRKRMQENTTKIQPVSEPKVSSPVSICAISLPDTLPEKVTLAPLPLFEKIRSRKSSTKQSFQQIGNKHFKDDTKEVELDGDIIEHRENLNERLKREFGFDVSEGITSSSNLNVSSNSNLENNLKNLGARPSTPPPPPPPPRLSRPSKLESVRMPIPATQFSFNPPFPRPQFMVPQVPGASYLPAQPTIMPAVHSINNTSAQCHIRPPLLPSTQSFTPSVTLLRPQQHDFTPVNAQRIAALVQQPPPPPPHNSYLHVYPSGLYK